VDQAINSIQKGNEVGMAIQKPRLEIDLFDRKKDGKERFMLCPQNGDAMILGQIPDVSISSQEFCSKDFGDGIGKEVENPVKHFHQEGELGKDSAVVVGLESRCVRSGDGGNTAA
jgi:hypothetical protein